MVSASSSGGQVVAVGPSEEKAARSLVSVSTLYVAHSFGIKTLGYGYGCVSARSSGGQVVVVGLIEEKTARTFVFFSTLYWPQLYC